MKLVKDVIADIVDRLRECAGIDSITQNGNLYTISTSDTKDLENGDYVTISGVKYAIRNLVTNTSFQVESTTAVTGIKWKACAPYYFHGTPIAVDNEIKTLRLPQQKYPLIFLWERIEEKFLEDKRSVTKVESRVKLFFMDQANYNDWTTEQHYDNVLVPMGKLSRDFVNAAKTSVYIANQAMKDIDYTKVSHAKWGLIVKEAKGAERQIFAEELSGVELRITLPQNDAVFTCDEKKFTEKC